MGFLFFEILSFIASSRKNGDIFQFTGSESTKTGLAPRYFIGFADAENVKDWQITSSPYPTPNCISAKCKAAVPELSAATNLSSSINS